MSNAHTSTCNHISTITIIPFSYHCHDSNTDDNKPHYHYYCPALLHVHSTVGTGTLCSYYAMLKFPVLFQLCFHLGTYYALIMLKILQK